MSYVVTIYIENMVCGGPEEGGWWFKCGEPSLKLKRFKNKRAAKNYARKANRPNGIVGKLNRGRAPLSSVLCDGIYKARLDSGKPRAYPDSIPHYE